MVRKGWTQVIVKDDLTERMRRRLEDEYRSKARKPQLSTYVQDILWQIIEEDEILRQCGPFLEKMTVESDRIFIKDNRMDEIAELRLKDGRLHCGRDNSFECVHVGFAWAIPEVYRTMKLQGCKMPITKKVSHD